jgi:hypothetical protein
MQEPDGARHFEFAKWYSQAKPSVSEATAWPIWDAAWELAVESTFIGLSEQISAPQAEQLLRHVNNMIEHYRHIRAERRSRLLPTYPSPAVQSGRLVKGTQGNRAP